MIRNLLYHLYPRRDSIWQWNLDQLLKRLDQFNGKKLMTIAVDDTTETADSVRALIPSCISTTVIHNNPNLGETATFPLMVRDVASVNHEEITFFGHGKGVTRSKREIQTGAFHQWADVMYSSLLDYPSLVDDAIQTHDFVGAILLGLWNFHRVQTPWFFPGTFFWFRHDKIFSAPRWNALYADRWGLERWPGNINPDPACAIGLVMNDPYNRTGGRYLPTRSYWDSVLSNRWRQFQIEREAGKPTGTIYQLYFGRHTQETKPFSHLYETMDLATLGSDTLPEVCNEYQAMVELWLRPRNDNKWIGFTSCRQIMKGYHFVATSNSDIETRLSQCDMLAWGWIRFRESLAQQAERSHRGINQAINMVFAAFGDKVPDAWTTQQDGPYCQYWIMSIERFNEWMEWSYPRVTWMIEQKLPLFQYGHHFGVLGGLAERLVILWAMTTNKRCVMLGGREARR